MKSWILLAVGALIAVPALAQVTASSPLTATYIAHDRVDAALAHKANIHLLTADNLAVEGDHRDKPGFVELHEKLTDVFYVTDGEATFVTGGQYEGGERFAPGQIRGGTLTGGTVHHLVKGDVIVIPAGVPHWFQDVPHSISYFVVKVVGL